MTTPPPKDPLDEILKDLQLKSFHAGNLGSDRKFGKNRDEAKQQILTHYISFDEVERLIGEDEPETGFGKRDGEYEMKCTRNELKAELKAALNKRRETK